MFCPKCGTEIPDGSQFCRSCGVALPGSAAPAQRAGTGLEPNVAALLCYVLGWVTGLVFYFIEKDNDFVRFHAVQSIVVFGAFTVASIVLSILQQIPMLWILFWLIQILLSILAVVLWVLLMAKAYRGQRYKLPWAGDQAEKYMARRPA